MSIQIGTRKSFCILKIMDFGHCYIRRITDDDIEAAVSLDDLVELGEPMEGLVRGLPGVEAAAGGGPPEMLVEDVVEGFEAFLQVLLGLFEGLHILGLRHLHQLKVVGSI